jgi:hypothetical protein
MRARPLRFVAHECSTARIIRGKASKSIDETGHYRQSITRSLVAKINVDHP